MASGGAASPDRDEAVAYHDRLDICGHKVSTRER
jgi:hypothetical protein